MQVYKQQWVSCRVGMLQNNAHKILSHVSLILSAFGAENGSWFCGIAFWGCGGWAWYLYTLMVVWYTMKCVRKRRKTYDKYRIVGATARDPQNKIKCIYSFECGTRRGARMKAERAGSQPYRKRTNNFDPPSPRDFTIDTYERSRVPKWKFTRPIMRSIMSLFAREVDRRPQVKPRLARARGYYNRICQSSFRYHWQDT